MTMFRLFVHFSVWAVWILFSVVVFSMHVSELKADKLMDRRQYLALRLDWLFVHSKTKLSSMSPFEDQSDSLLITVGARSSRPIQIDTGAHLVPYTMATG